MNTKQIKSTDPNAARRRPHNSSLVARPQLHTAHAGATIVAGFETTATTASYILWCVARHSALKERLLDDILREGIYSRYLDMFIKEVMRMYPALANFIIRSPKEEALVAGRLIERGMSVYLGVNTIHYDETIYPDPYKFDPERFAEG